MRKSQIRVPRSSGKASNPAAYPAMPGTSAPIHTYHNRYSGLYHQHITVRLAQHAAADGTQQPLDAAPAV